VPFKAAARSVAKRSAPIPRRGRKARRGGGSGACNFTTGALAEDYLRLCRDPLRDLQRWMDEDKKRGRAGRGVQLITRRGEDAAKDTTTATNYLAQADRLRGQPLHAVQGRLDKDRPGGRSSDSVPARPRAGADRYDGLQQVRADSRAAAGLGRVASDAFSSDARRLFRTSRAMLADSKGSRSGGTQAPSALVGASMGANPGWPDAMKRELSACKTPADLRAWAERWAATLGGQTGGAKPDAPTRPQTVARRAGAAWKPS
jgi:hypothetical protein